MDELIGIKTNLWLKTDELVEGWHYADTQLGYYIALDPDGKFIRFVPSGKWQSAGYDHKSEKARFRPANFDDMIKSYQELEEDLWGPMAEAINMIDLNHLRRIGLKINQIRYELENGRGHFADEAPLNLVLAARANHEELLDEIARSGIQGILIEEHFKIRNIISEYTIPSIDAYYTHRSEINYMINLAKEEDYLSETDLGKQPLSRLSPEVLTSTEESPAEVKETSESDDDGKRKARRLRSAAAWLKITTGGGLATANLTLGAVAGVVSAIPTLGLGTVAAVVGIATSTYTGLNAASDALKDMASNLEKK